MTEQERQVLTDIYKTLENVNLTVEGLDGTGVEMAIAIAKLGTLLLLGDGGSGKKEND